MITAKILLDSIYQPKDSRLTTFELTYPRFIHCEVMTHRALSKNSASSRAIPLRRMIEMVGDEPAWPEYWASEQKGMQGGKPLTGQALERVQTLWDEARFHSLRFAEMLGREGLHKSLCNRRLEADAHMTVILTGESAGLNNFFKLRAHPAAQPEFQVLAFRMLDALLKSAPDVLDVGEWHIPFAEDLEGMATAKKLAIATGRIARVSYLTHDGQRDPAQDAELHHKLLQGVPPHMSPFEHCATPTSMRLGDKDSGNFGHHWFQYRKYWRDKGETTYKVNHVELMAAKPTWITL